MLEPSATIDDLIAKMQRMLVPLTERDDELQHFHATYLRTTVAVKEAIERGGFRDNAWVEEWDLRFADLYLEALDAWNRTEPVPSPWRIAFEATGEPDLPHLRYVLLGMNAHINYDLPQALLAVITDAEFEDPAVVAKRSADHEHIDDILAARVAAEDRELMAIERPGERTVLDRMLQPFNRVGTKRFLKEARRKVWNNARRLNVARRQGPEALAARLRELDELSGRRVADLRRPGQVLLRLARHGFGVELSG